MTTPEQLKAAALVAHNEGKSVTFLMLDYGTEYLVTVGGQDFIVTELDFGPPLVEPFQQVMKTA